MTHRFPRIAATVATIAAAALALSACAGDPEPEQTSAGTPDPDATLSVGLVLEPTNLDIRHTSGAALEQILIDNVYEGLVSRSETNEIEPRLASDYEVSEDGLTYTFTLNEGVTFHDGNAMTSADVVASYEAVRTDTALQGNSEFAGVQSVTAPDASTVVITLAEPDQNFLFSLTGPGGLVFRSGDETDLQTAANGTGPFTLTRWSKGSSISLSRFDGYWGEQATIGAVDFHYIPDFTSGVNAALDGTVDVLTAVDPQLAPQLEEDGGFTLTTGKTTDKGTLAFNNAVAPLDDVRVRQALRMAIDHEGIAEATGLGEPLYGPIPELDPGYEDLSDVIEYDPEQARELLADAGYDGLELTLTIPNFYSTSVTQLLVSDLAAIGVDLEVDSVEFATWLEDVHVNKDYELSFVLHVEPRDFYNFANPDYYFGYDNPEVQRLYAQSQAEIDPDASAELLAEAARLVAEDSPVDWLYVGTTITALRHGVDGFPKNSINSRIDLAGVTVDG